MTEPSRDYGDESRGGVGGKTRYYHKVRIANSQTASPKVATELVAVIHEHTPLESPKKSLSKSPSGPDDSAV